MYFLCDALYVLGLYLFLVYMYNARSYLLLSVVITATLKLRVWENNEIMLQCY